MMNFIYSFFNQPSIIIGLITMIGLIALRKPISDILSGTFKTILGFIILSSGGGIISDTLVEYFLFQLLKNLSICKALCQPTKL